jgi:ferrous iron transport protein B
METAGRLRVRRLRVALAGNANVGKSVIFNQLTGLHQHIGNWPGKTVERAEGTLRFDGYVIDVVDLPGIYSLSPYSLEELISREYIAVEQPDVIINIVDASTLERNLFFTLQLMELEPRMVVALNMVDVAEEKGIYIDAERLSKRLGVPVVPTVATRGLGLTELMRRVVEIAEGGERVRPLRYGPEVERRIEELMQLLRGVETPYPSRWVAIKLLEGDEEMERVVYKARPQLRGEVERLRREVEEIHGHDAPSVIASERYAVASSIAIEVTELRTPRRRIIDKLEEVTVHPLWGYVIMTTVILATLYGVFTLGDHLSLLIEGGIEGVRGLYILYFGSSPLIELVWRGVIEGLIAGVTIALPYIAPLYIALSLLEDSGYLARIAYLMDSATHKIGLHGKGFIPLMMGFGCNVPAVLSCRIMETDRERLLCAFAATLIPCAARGVVIMGLVSRYLGFQWALTLYILDLIIVFALGRIAFRVVPGEPLGLIMEMPPYRWPTVRVTLSKTWFKLRDFILKAFPIMVAGNFFIHLSDVVGLLPLVVDSLRPVTVWWLGLPPEMGVTLIFGLLRKELALVMIASLLGTSDFSAVMTPIQMYVYSLVVMIYIPCLATIAVLVREFGVRRALVISLAEIGLAFLLGGVIYRLSMLIP